MRETPERVLGNERWPGDICETWPINPAFNMHSILPQEVYVGPETSGWQV